MDFYSALRQIDGFELLGEDEDAVEADEDFAVLDNNGNRLENKLVPRKIFFTFPDARALKELVSLWNRYKNEGEEITRPHTQWKKVFAHLRDVRPWGPQDRVTQETKTEWRECLSEFPNNPVRFEVEFWHREKSAIRERGYQRLLEIIHDAEGQVLHRSTIPEIRYDAVLVEVRPEFIQQILDHPDTGIATFDEVMVLRSQSLIEAPQVSDLKDVEDINPIEESEMGPPIAALIDGLPMSQHNQLANFLEIDDPNDFASAYGQASQQVHGTSMASLILHGDLNNSIPTGPIKRRLYVRPVMYPQSVGFDEIKERMPQDRLAIDLIWSAFIRMFEGEDGGAPTAPNVRVVNLSLGDPRRRFAGVLSPWARLIDYLAWRYRVLILVSAGNIRDLIVLDGIATWHDFESISPDEREAVLLRAILRNRAKRSLLAPSDSVNCLTIGAAHSDEIAPDSSGRAMTVDPYDSVYLPNPSSALGLGYLRRVKPDILLPGGREYVQAIANTAPISVKPVLTGGKYFGIGAAAPGVAGQTSKKLNVSGTSVATALATHGALRILDAIEELPVKEPHPAVDPSYYAVILKALLVHSAKWDATAASKIKEISKENGENDWIHNRDDITRLLGFGVADINRVIDCTEKRATLIRSGVINVGEADEFRLPIPIELENQAGLRAVIATAAWFSPLNITHRKYRMAELKVDYGSDKELSLGVTNAKDQPVHHVFGRGTVFHRRWDGRNAKPFVDNGDIVLNLSCSSPAGGLDDSIPYAVVVTLEVGTNVQVEVYNRVRERLIQKLPVANI